MFTKLVMTISWVSIFAQVWLMIFRIIPRNDTFVWAFMFVFALLIFFAEALRVSKKEKTQ